MGVQFGFVMDQVKVEPRGADDVDRSDVDRFETCLDADSWQDLLTD